MYLNSLEKLTTELASTDNVLRTKDLREINEDFHHAHKINFALDSSDILTQLVKAFSDKDDVIRELASRSVIQVCKTEKGREIIVNRKIVEDIAKLFNDSVVKIRHNAYSALINLSEFRYGIDNVIEFNII